ncbi:MAG TPA: hypothetical protein VM734_07935 [Kofleriaceae bacterium]|jgi:hypothetical protein|nr:hypothetical protein [Kofleriaceae bacterium]
MTTATTTSTSRELEPDPVPAELRVVVELFTGELAKVSFPDVDAAVLQREVEVLSTRAREVARARDALALAESALAQRTAALAQLAARGLAYARIYAEAHPDQVELARKLDATVAAAAQRTVGSLATPVAPRRRGRPPRTPRAELPFERTDRAELLAEAAQP